MAQSDQEGPSNLSKLQLALITGLGALIILSLALFFLSPLNDAGMTRDVASMIALHNLISPPGSVAFNTTTTDPNVTLSIGPNKTELGGYHTIPIIIHIISLD
jgi:hypothetical protein